MVGGECRCGRLTSTDGMNDSTVPYRELQICTLMLFKLSKGPRHTTNCVDVVMYRPELILRHHLVLHHFPLRFAKQ